MQPLALEIRRLRDLAGLTSKQVAQATGLDLAYYVRIECSQVRSPALSALRDIAKAVGKPDEAIILFALAIEDRVQFPVKVQADLDANVFLAELQEAAEVGDLTPAKIVQMAQANATRASKGHRR